MGHATNNATLRRSVLTDSTLNNKTVTDVIVEQYGSTTVIGIVETGGTHYIKLRHGKIDIGGDNEFGTGTLQIRNEGGR